MAREVVLQTPPKTLPYEAVVQRYTPYVWHVARGVLRDPAAAEDATQEAFVALLARTEPFAAEPVLRTWLGRVACRAALKITRSRDRRTAREQVVASRRAEREEATMAQDDPEQSAELRARLDDLPAEERVILRLKYVNGLPQSEIAEILDCSTGTVSNRLRASLTTLRQALARGGFAVALPALETRLSAIESDPVPSTLVPRLLRLEAPASLPLAKGGSTMLPKLPVLLLSGVAVLAAAFGLTQLLPGEDGAPPPATHATGDVARAPRVPAAPPPRLAGRGNEAEARAGAPAEAEPPAPVPTRRKELVALSGRVIAPDGTPAEGATILVETPVKASPRHRTRVVTDRDGVWEVVDLPARPSWVVAVRHAGGAPWRDTVTASDVVTRLHASWSVRGVLRDERGEPVAGLTPAIMGTKTGSYGTRIESDASGRFVIADLDPAKRPPAETWFELKHPDYLPIRLEDFADRVGPDGWAFVEVRLEDGATIDGTVRGPDGTALSKARLLLVPKGTSPSDLTWNRREETAGETGGFAFRGLRAGEWVVRARAEDLVLETPVVLTLDEREQRPVELRLGRGRTLTGRVVDGSGRPVPTAEIACDDVMDAMFMGRERAADDDGRFRFTGLSWERRSFRLFLTYLPLLARVPLRVEVVSATPRALDVVIHTPALLPEPDPTATEDEEPQGQVLIPSADATVTFPESD